IGVRISDDVVDVRARRGKRNRVVEIPNAVVDRMAFQQSARAAEQIAVGICRLKIEQLVEEMNRPEVIEERPAREAGTGQCGDARGRALEPGGVPRQDRRLSVRVHRRDDGRHARVVAKAIRILPQKELSLDATAIAFDIGRMRVDDARELADRLLVTTLIDEELPLLRGTVRRVCRRERSIDKQRENDPNGCTRDKATSRPTTHRVLRGGEARLYQMAELWTKRQSERCRRDWKTRRMEDVEFANTALDQPLNLLVPAEVRQQRASAA